MASLDYLNESGDESAQSNYEDSGDEKSEFNSHAHGKDHKHKHNHNHKKDESSSESSSSEDEIADNVSAPTNPKKASKSLSESRTESTQLVESQWNETEVVYRFKGSPATLGNSSASVKADLPKEHFGGDHNQIISSIELVDYANNFPISLMFSIDGIADAKAKEKFSHTGVKGNECLYAGRSETKINKPLIDKDSSKGLNFLKKYPGKTPSNIEDGITRIKGSQECVVHVQHPVVDLVKLVESSNGGKGKIKRAMKDHVSIEEKTVDAALEMLKSDMKKNMPIINLNDISLCFAPAFASKNPISDIAADIWTTAQEFVSDKYQTDTHRTMKLEREYDCIVTLRFRHTPVTSKLATQ